MSNKENKKQNKIREIISKIQKAIQSTRDFNIKGINIYDVLFLIAFALWFVPHHLVMTEWNSVTNVDRFSASYFMWFRYIVLFLVYFFAKKFNRREMYFDLAFLAIAGAVAYSLDSKLTIKAALFIVVAKSVNYKKIMAFMGCIMAVIMAATVAGSIYGIIPNTNWNVDLTCYAFGYDYSTFLGYTVFFLTIMYIIVRERITIVEAITPILLQIPIYIYTDTMTTLLLTIMMMVAYVIINKGFKTIPKVIGILGTLVPFGAFFASLAIAKLYTGGQMQGSSGAATSILMRLTLAHNALNDYSIKFLGQNIRWVGAGTQRKHPDMVYNYVDNFYIKNLLTYGLVYIVVLLAAFTVIIYRAYRKQQYGLFVGLICLMVFGILDAEVIDIRFHPLMLLVSMAWSYGIIKMPEKLYIRRRHKGKSIQGR